MKPLLTIFLSFLSLIVFAQDINTQGQEANYKSIFTKTELVKSTKDEYLNQFEDFTLVIYYDKKSFKRSLKGKKVRSISLTKDQKKLKKEE